MSDPTIFDEGNTTPPAVVPPAAPVLPDTLKELVGEGKKYASVEKALESIPHAQTHISTLETELKALREKVSEATAVEEVYKKLMESMNQPPAKTTTELGLDEASVAAIFDRRMQEHAERSVAEANVRRVKEALVGKYGEKASEVYAEKARDLGVTTAFLNDVVKKSPKAAEELFGIKPKEPAATSSTGSVRSDTLNNTRPPTPAKSVMGGATSSEVLDSWRRAHPNFKE